MGTSALVCKEPGEQAEGERKEEASTTFAEATAGRGHVKQAHCRDKGDSSSLIKYAPVVKADGFVGQQISSPGGQLRQTRCPIASGVGSTGRSPSADVPGMLQQTRITQRRPTPGQWATHRKSRREKMSSNAQFYTRF